MRKKHMYILFSIIVLSLLLLVLLSIFVFIYYQKQKIPTEAGAMDIYFCPQDGCENVLLEYIHNASKIHCAFYDVDAPVFDALKEKERNGADVSLVLERDNAVTGNFVFVDDRSAYMHNKFCIFDDSIVMTGSMNPTNNGMHKNANNLVFIESTYLSKNYEAEFASFVSRDFGWDEEVRYPKILFNGFVVENYFCPEDACEEQILRILHEANESIYFMQFSFTSDPIGDLLVEKSEEGVDVKGVFEKQQNSKWSQYENLLNQGINVSFALNDGKLHHKVFIIDEKIVIFGSMNPSKNGNEKNDENILIVHDGGVATQFMRVFDRQ